MAVSALTKSGNAGGGNHNPITGSFGRGIILPLYVSGTFVAPFDGLYRVRLWGAGGGASTSNQGGAGGGFSLRTIELNKGDSIPYTVGVGGAVNSNGGSTSFGNFCSATGGASRGDNSSAATLPGGNGYGGDINTKGGYVSATVSAQGGAGAGSVFGDGGMSLHQTDQKYIGLVIGNKRSHGSLAGTAMFTYEGKYLPLSHFMVYQECSSIDFIGAGVGESTTNVAASGGGGFKYDPGFPGGGAGNQSVTRSGADGLIIVEY